MMRAWSQRRHAVVRQQQRGIPPLIVEWLLDYGREAHDGRGGVRHYFDQRAWRNLEREFGRAVVTRLAEWRKAYLVVSTDGALITVGHRWGRVRD